MSEKFKKIQKTVNEVRYVIRYRDTFKAWKDPDGNPFAESYIVGTSGDQVVLTSKLISNRRTGTVKKELREYGIAMDSKLLPASYSTLNKARAWAKRYVEAHNKAASDPVNHICLNDLDILGVTPMSDNSCFRRHCIPRQGCLYTYSVSFRRSVQ